MEDLSRETVYFVEAEIKKIMPVPENMPSKIYGIEEANSFFSELIGNRTVENFYIIYMNSSYDVVGLSLIAKGDISEVTFSMSEAMRMAILTNAKFFLMAHNHPSGDVTPSKRDIDFTKQIGRAAAMFGIELLDSIIVNGDGKAHSIREDVVKKNI